MGIKRIFIVRSYSRTNSEIASFCADAFRELGLGAEVFSFNPYRYSSLPGGRFFGRLEYRMAERSLFSRVREFSPDLVLVIKGDELLPGTVAGLRSRSRAPVANWWIDDPGLLDISSGLSPAYDLFFTNDPDSVAAHEAAGCRFARFLTFACSPAAHHAVRLTAEEAGKYAGDIVFVGLLTPYRVKVLEALKDFKLRIWASPVVREYLPEKRTVIQRDIPASSPLRPLLAGREAWGEELAKVYSGAKIVLNIHSHGKSDPNMRVFEATACGAFLLTEERRVLKDFFEPGRELVCYKDAAELKALALYYLENEKERAAIAGRGQGRAYREHTYVHRMRELLAYVEEFSGLNTTGAGARDGGSA
ncbi:MAG: glycosyltransferase [Elusimicrobia bacterium]|nr:glycosyltransferase [Elusimicrobiota bacterium]